MQSYRIFPSVTIIQHLTKTRFSIISHILYLQLTFKNIEKWNEVLKIEIVFSLRCNSLTKASRSRMKGMQTMLSTILIGRGSWDVISKWISPGVEERVSLLSSMFLGFVGDSNHFLWRNLFTCFYFIYIFQKILFSMVLEPCVVDWAFYLVFLCYHFFQVFLDEKYTEGLFLLTFSWWTHEWTVLNRWWDYWSKNEINSQKNIGDSWKTSH